jgi:uncharacterized membrane protein SirB2
VYAALKSVHVLTVLITISLFALRGYWMLVESPRLQAKWAKVVPHINDTFLLVTAVALAVIIGQSPHTHGWLAAKVIGLLIYIVLGTIALKRGRTKSIRTAAYVASLLTVGYIVAVAVTRDPFPFLS